MAKPWIPYVVQRGDHLQAIAYRFGSDPDTVWSNEKNKDLASRRKNRNTLLAGDVVYVPSEKRKGMSLTAGSDNRYQATPPTVHLKLHVNSASSPVANKAFEVRGVPGDPIRGAASGDSVVEFDVPVTVRSVEVWFPDVGIKLPLHVGALDPIDEPTGAIQRLRNLLYLPLAGAVTPEQVADATRAFQKDFRLNVDGVLSEQTLKALLDGHKS